LVLLKRFIATPYWCFILCWRLASRRHMLYYILYFPFRLLFSFVFAVHCPYARLRRQSFAEILFTSCLFIIFFSALIIWIDEQTLLSCPSMNRMVVYALHIAGHYG
jgi:hypothetical protein